MMSDEVIGEAAVDIQDADVHMACKSILDSQLFSASPRMRRLLEYLVEKAIERDTGAMSEYAIGIRVFDRRPLAYSTTEDPIVRVQVGRLRAKLKAYYASPGSAPSVEITIPAGSYMPVFRRVERSAGGVPEIRLLKVAPFKCVSLHVSAESFTEGLYEELVHHIQREFGNVIVGANAAAVPCQDGHLPGCRSTRRGDGDYALDGSVQTDSGRMRITARILEVATGSIVWSEQFDRREDFSIASEEELARSICAALKRTA